MRRIKYLDKLMMWLMTIMILLPSFGQSYSGFSALAAENDQIIDTVLYEGSDGSADVSATLAEDQSQIHWKVTLNKMSTEVASRQQLEVDVSGSGLSAPHTLSSNAASETTANVMQLQANAFTNDATNITLTFVTDVLDMTQSEYTLKMAVATVTEDTASTIMIHTSPDTKTLTFNIPRDIPIEEEIPIEEAVPEVVEPIQVEDKEVIEEPVEEVEEIVVDEKVEDEIKEEVIEEVKEDTDKIDEEIPPTKPTIDPESTDHPEEEQPTKELDIELPLAPEIEVEAEEVFDPNIAEPVSKDYVSRSFSPTVGLKAKTATMFRTQATQNNPGSIELNKTAEECLTCRTYKVTLDITGTPPERPLDVVLMLDRSGSMSENTYTYTRITSNPSTNSSYYVKVNNQYVEVNSYWSGTSSGWRYRANNNWYYVSHSQDGNDSADGNRNSNNPTSKPFYSRSVQSRMDALKQAAINFADLVLQDSNNRVAVVSFAGPSSTNGNGSQSQASQDLDFTNNLSSIQTAINALVPVNGTNTEAGLRQGNTTFINDNRASAKKVGILFTDGLPTASNNNRYNESTDPNTIHFSTAETAANLIKNYAELYTIGLTQGMSTTELSAARTFLNRVNNAAFVEAPTPADLEQIFADIFSQLDNYGTNAVVTDVVGDDFHLIESSLPSNATYNSATKTITWQIGTLVDDYQLSYEVKANDNVVGSSNPNDKLPTNEWAKLTHTDVNGTTNQEKFFPVPYVHVPLNLVIETTDVTILSGDTIQLGTGTNSTGENYLNVTGGTGNYTYEWYLGTNKISDEKNPEITTLTEKTYRVVVTDEKGCETTEYITVKVKKGNLTVHKVDEAGSLIKSSSASFTLSKDGVDVTLTTGSTGIVTFNNLVKGVYTLTETAAPTGYVADPTTYTVTVSWENGAVKVTVKDAEQNVIPANPLEIVNEAETMEIPVNKHWDDNDNALNLRPTKITVNLYKPGQTAPVDTIDIEPGSEGNWAGVFIEVQKYDQNGLAIDYYIEEEDVAHYDSAVDGFDIYNTIKVGKLTITKVDASDPNNHILLDDAKFELRDLDGNVIQDGVTEDGILTFTNIPYGNYLLVETKAPVGYALPITQWEVTIGGDAGQDLVMTITNTKLTTLPATGGMGTTLFTMAGISLMSLAAWFIKKDKTDKNPNGGNKND